jgi:hypothetical protein
MTTEIEGILYAYERLMHACIKQAKDKETCPDPSAPRSTQEAWRAFLVL